MRDAVYQLDYRDTTRLSAAEITAASEALA